MIEVVVFGKPKSFESYAFDFGDSQVRETENSHHEPIVKPIDYNDIVFHYYQKDDIAGWEVYRRCKGYDAERPGIIFGVGIKSDKDFGLIDTMGNLLKPLWEDFAQAFLDKNYKFQFESIVNALKTTKWSPEEEEKVRNNVSKESIKTANQERPLLLLTIENPNEIKTIEDIIKEYNDVYIASNTDIFKNLINKDVLAKQANNEIYTVKDGKIGPLQESDPDKSTGKDEQNENKSWITWIWGGKSSNSSSTSASKESDKKNPKIPSKLIAAVATIAIIIAVALFVFPKLVNKPADRIILAKAPELGNITDGLVITSKFYCGESEKTSTKLEDVVWTVKGNGRQFVIIPPLVEGKNLYLRLSDEYYKTKHPETQISLYGSVKGNDLKMEGNSITVPAFKGRPANYCELLERKDIKAIENKFPDNKDIIAFLAYREGTVNNKEVVSTTKDEISFSVTPSGYAEIKKDSDGNWKLFVKNDRPKSDSNIEVTVMASLKDKEIGKQKYTIVAKKETTNTPPSSVDVSGEIAYAKRTDFRNPSDANNAKDEHYILSSSLSIREGLTNYYFIARDKNGTKLLGTWKCSGIDLPSTKKVENPLNFASTPEPGTYMLEYWVGNKKQASINITITQ